MTLSSKFLPAAIFSSLLLASCQTTAPLPAPPVLRYQGDVSWYPDAIPVTYKPTPSIRMETGMEVEGRTNTDSLSMRQTHVGDLACDSYGNDILCRIGVIRLSETRNGKTESVDINGRLKIEFIADKYGHTRAARLVDNPSINREAMGKFNDVLQAMIDRMLNEYPSSGIRVGERIYFARNKTYTNLDGKSFTITLEALAKGKSRYQGRDVIVIDLSGRYRQEPIDAELQGYGLIDISSGFLVFSEVQSYINERGATALLKLTSRVR